MHACGYILRLRKNFRGKCMFVANQDTQLHCTSRQLSKPCHAMPCRCTVGLSYPDPVWLSGSLQNGSTEAAQAGRKKIPGSFAVGQRAGVSGGLYVLAGETADCNVGWTSDARPLSSDLMIAGPRLRGFPDLSLKAIPFSFFFFFLSCHSGGNSANCRCAGRRPEWQIVTEC